MSKKIEIYCVTNKAIKELETLDLILAGVGKNVFSEKYIICKEGYTINDKEKHYSELTFHYWFWQNQLSKISDDTWIGFCQKRRFWLKSKNENLNDELEKIILKDVPKEWDNYNSVICEPIKLGTKLSKLIKRGWRNLIKKPQLIFNHQNISIKVHFDMHHGYGVLDKAIDLMDQKDREDFRNYVNTKTVYNPHIMFISKKEIIDKYFKELFSWLSKCEKIFGFEKLKGYGQTRLYAYLAERYLSFWFKKYTNYFEWPWTFYEKN